MANLYTLKTSDEALAPLQNYSGNNSYLQALAQQKYNTAGRTVQNSFDPLASLKAKANSVENALGTTAAAVISPINDAIQNAKTSNLLKDNSAKLDSVAQKYGYDSYNAILGALDQAEANGDNATLEAIQNNDALWTDLQNQSAANLDAMKANNDAYKDYVENNYVSQKINQDRGKFAGSAINTLSTAFDVMAPGAGVLANGIQGGIEGIADELEQNGLENFDWGNAAQRAGVGVATGLATGGLNKALNNKLASNGGNFFKGSNGLTKAINTAENAINSKTGGLVNSVARGALSGATGGATAAGLTSAINGEDIGTGLSNTLTGALQGAGQGATMSGMLGVANKAIDSGTNKIKNSLNTDNKIGKKIYDQIDSLQNPQGYQEWKQSGENFKERLDNTLHSGNSDLGNKIVKNQLAKGIQKGADGNEPRTKNQVEFFEENGQQKIGPKSQLGFSLAEEQPTSNSIITQNIENVKPTINNADDAANDLINLYRNGASWNDLKDVAAGYEMSNGINADEIMSKAYSELPSDNTTRTTNGLQEQINQDVIAQRQAMGKGDTETVNALGKRVGENRTKLNRESTQTTSTAQEPTAEETQIYDTFTKKQPAVETEQQDLTKLAKAKNLRETSAKELLSQVGTVNARAAKADNMVENVQSLSKMGLTTPEEWEVASDLMTGRNGKLSKLHTKIMASAGEVNTMDGAMKNESLNDTIDRLIKDTGLTDSEATSTKNIIEGKLNKLSSRRNGSITGTDDAMEVMDVVRDLESRARDLKGQNSSNNKMTDPAREDKAKVIDSVADILEERIYDNVGDVSKYMTDDVINELKSAFPNNEKWAYAIDNDVATIKDAKSLRAAQKKFVQTSDYLANARGNFGTYGQRVGDTANNILAKGLSKIPVVGGFASELANTAPVNRAFANINNARANKLEGVTGETLLTSKKLGNTQTNNQTAQGTTGRTAQNMKQNMPSSANASTQTNNQTAQGTTGRTAQNMKQNMPSSANASTQTYIVDNPETRIYDVIGRISGINEGDDTQNYIDESNEWAQAQNEAAQSLNQLAQIESANSASSSNSNSNTQLTAIANAMEQARQEGNAQVYGQLYEMYQEALEDSNSNSVSNWSSSAQSELTDALNGLDQIDTLEELYNQAGGGQGWLAGGLANIGASIGDLNTAGKTYNQYAESIGTALVKNLVNLGATESDVKRYVDYIPSLSDTQEAAEEKLAMLRSLYQSKINNLYQVNGQ